MNHIRFSLLLAAILSVLFWGCQKKTGLSFYELRSRQALIEEAHAYFTERVLNLPSAATDHNPRTTGARIVDWNAAHILELSHGLAVLVPVHYTRPFLIMTSFSGDRLFNINDQVQLLIYQDSAMAFHAQVVSAFPDSGRVVGGPFQGVVLVDEWNGAPINRYRYDRNTIGVYTPTEHKATSWPAPKAPTTYTTYVQVTCSVLYGYNYSADDPSGGYYWEEEIGCSVSGSGTGGSGPSSGDYAGVPGGSSGGSPSTSAIVKVISGTNPIGNIRDYLKCYDNIPGTDHTYTVTICVDQPIPGTRAPWTFAGKGSTSDLPVDDDNPVNTGHTFLIMTEITPNGITTRNLGFYPLSIVYPGHPAEQGQLNNNSSAPYNISLAVTVTSSQFFQMLDYISHGNDNGYMYDLNANNCTTFALHALAAGGVGLPSTVGYWPGGSGNDPGDLGEDIRSLPLSPGMTKSTSLDSHPNLGSCY
jgi:hypothetical protein